MTKSLLARLPQLLPRAQAWAAEVQAAGLKSGKPLAFWQQADAREVGVRDVGRVRICLIEAMPSIPDPVLATAVGETGLLGSSTLGLTLGHAVFILRAHAGQRRLLRHELRHVAQCESLGSLDAFLAEYLGQLARFGYSQSPLEVDARSHECRSRSSPA
jgi:hypothetical protein